MPVSRKNVLDEATKPFISLNLHPWGHDVLIFCQNEKRAQRALAACHSKPFSQGKSLLQFLSYAPSWPLVLWNRFRAWKNDRHTAVIQSWALGRHFLENKQRGQLTVFVANEKIQALKQILEFWKTRPVSSLRLGACLVVPAVVLVKVRV